MNNLNLSQLKAYLPKFLIGAGAVIVLVTAASLVISFINAQTPPKLISNVPISGDNSVSPFTHLTFTFDRAMSQSNKTHLSVSPNVTGQFFIQGVTIDFAPSTHLSFGQTYTVTLTNPESSAGKEGTSITLTFTVKPESALSATEEVQYQREQDLLARQEAAQSSQTLDGQKAAAKLNLITSLPYDSAQFTIEYLRDQDEFMVTINANPYATNKQAADDWIKSKGVQDLSWFNFQYGSLPGVYP